MARAANNGKRKIEGGGLPTNQAMSAAGMIMVWEEYSGNKRRSIQAATVQSKGPSIVLGKPGGVQPRTRRRVSVRAAIRITAKKRTGCWDTAACVSKAPVATVKAAAVARRDKSQFLTKPRVVSNMLLDFLSPTIWPQRVQKVEKVI